MILVTLGTQKQQFTRLLKMVDEAIDKGLIKEDVYVQAGNTKYESKKMKIFDFVSIPELEDLILKSNLLITHGGVGSITTAIKRGKKIIAVARLSKYNEHVNDHQLQIVNEFSKKGYLLGADETNFNDVIKKMKGFKPSKFEDNIDNLINTITDYIDRL